MTMVMVLVVLPIIFNFGILQLMEGAKIIFLLFTHTTD